MPGHRRADRVSWRRGPPTGVLMPRRVAVNLVVLVVVKNPRDADRYELTFQHGPNVPPRAV